MLVLLVLWAALLLGGFMLGRPDAQKTRRMPLGTRLGSSAVLVLAGWSWYWLASDTASGPYAVLIAVGMTLGLVGDLFMARVIPAGNRVLGGMGAFGLGHLAYIAAFLVLGGRLGLLSALLWAAWLAWLLAGVAGWYLVLYRGQKPTPLHWVALPYALLLASTAGLATGLALQAPILLPLAIGGGLFFLSDLILAARIFNGRYFPLIEDVIWLTYGPGQMLIVFGGRL